MSLSVIRPRVGVALALFVAFGRAQAQSSSPASMLAAPRDLDHGPVVAVRFDPALESEDPWSVTGLHPGEALSRQRARDALRRALESGTFATARASIAVAPGGVELVIDGERQVNAREVAFLGVRGRSSDAVRTEFGIVPGSWVTIAATQEAAEQAEAAYRENGWPEATVRVRWRATDDPSTRLLLVEVNEGDPTRVRRVTLQGVPAPEADAVRRVVGLETNDVANPQVARRSPDALLTALRRDGYFEATVDSVQLVTVGPREADVVVAVHTGPQFVFRWTGIEPFPATALDAMLRRDEERGLDSTALGVYSARTRDFFVRRGFLDAQASVEVRRQPALGTGEIQITVQRRARTVVQSVRFEGAGQLPETLLREQLTDVLTAELPVGEYARPSNGALPAGASDAELSGGLEFLWLRPERTYVPELYAEAAQRMVARYREAGFLDASVPPPRIARTNGPDGSVLLDVTYSVTIGPRTELDAVQFEGNVSIASRALAELLGLRLGVPLSFSALDAARTNLADHYREQGFLFVRVEPHIERSPDRTHARVRFEIREGPAVRVGHVSIRGLDRTDEWVVRQRIELQPGEPYRPSLVRATQRRLAETGFFVGATVTPVDPDVPAPVKDVVVQVTEVLPQYLELRGGFSTGEGLRAGMEYGYRNISLGALAVTAALSVQLGYQVLIAPGDPQYAKNFESLSIGDRLRRRISLSFVMPAIRPLGSFWRASLDLGTSRMIERQFAIDTNSVAATLMFRPERAWSLTMTPEFQVNTLDLLGAQGIQSIIQGASPGDRERLVRLLLLPTGTTVLEAFRVTATMDRRDQVFNTRRGIYASATAEIVGTQQLVQSPGLHPGNTVHTVASVAGYVPLPFLGIVLASNLRAGLNVRLDQDGCRVTYTNRQFFMGGSDSLRGWLQDTLVPQDVVDSYNGRTDVADPCPANGGLFPASLRNQADDLIAATQRGGDVMLNWRNELRVPLGNSGFAVGGFVDVGNLWKNMANVSFAMRTAAGGGLRYVTPIGPVAFDLGVNLAPQRFELPFAFHFSIGIF